MASAPDLRPNFSGSNGYLFVSFCPLECNFRSETKIEPYLRLGSTWKTLALKQIEGIQWRAARFVKNCYKREPETVINLLNELNWIPLKERGTISPLTLFHKAVHDDGGLAFPHYVMKRRRNFRGRPFDFWGGYGWLGLCKNFSPTLASATSCFKVS